MDNGNRSLVQRLITGEHGLRYCCMWAFFSLFSKTSHISMRLGIHPSTVKEYKIRFRAGEFKCQNCDRCMKKSVKGVLADRR